MLIVDNNNGITLTRGDTAEFVLTVEEAGTETEYDFSNDTVKFGVKRNAYDTEYVLEKTVDSETGKLKLTHDDTKDLEFGDYLYSVRIEHTVEAESEEDEDTTEIYTPIAGARFSLGYDIVRDSTQA